MEYVLCRNVSLTVPNRHLSFVCKSKDGSSPFTWDEPLNAIRFKSIDEAFKFRELQMATEFEAKEYRIHAVLSDGRLIDVEPECDAPTQ